MLLLAGIQKILKSMSFYEIRFSNVLVVFSKKQPNIDQPKICSPKCQEHIKKFQHIILQFGCATVEKLPTVRKPENRSILYFLF